ncbi:MAG: hypothetical protein NTZ09_15340 [Candidatus Hydrogenedentes bacterium]|nr:hypothetical protein [Candidatus Hydrogenedentota bacterium]
MTANYKLKAINPVNPQGPKTDITIPGDLIERYFKYDSVRFDNLEAAKHVLENTVLIFSGVRMFNKGGWCYVGYPEMWTIRENVTAPFPRNMVFAVYVNALMVLYECRAEIAEKIEGEEQLYPKDWKNRYGGLIWKSTF